MMCGLYFFNHRYFITFGKLSTFNTVRPYLLWKDLFIGSMKPASLKKAYLICKKKYLSNVKLPRLFNTCIDKHPADTFFSHWLCYTERAYLRKIIPADMERTRTDDLPFFEDKIVPQIIVELARGLGSISPLDAEKFMRL